MVWFRWFSPSSAHMPFSSSIERPEVGEGLGSFRLMEAIAPPRQWPGQRWMSWFWLLAASQLRALALKIWSYFSMGEGVMYISPFAPRKVRSS